MRSPAEPVTILDLDRHPAESPKVELENHASVDLENQHLSSKDLTQFDLRGANLHHRDLSDSTLNGADLCDTVLRWADLSHSKVLNCKNASPTQFGGANLRNAEISGTVDLAPCLEFVNNNIRYARTLTLSLVAVCVYCLFGLLGMSDSQMLADSGKFSLPLVGIAMAPTHFLYLTPVIIAFITTYVYLHLSHTWQAMADLPRRLPDGRHIWQALSPWLPSTTVAQRFFTSTRTRASRWLWQLVETVVYRLPYLTCLLYWGRTVALHRPLVSEYFAIVFFAVWIFSLERRLKRDSCFDSPWNSINENRWEAMFALKTIGAAILLAVLTVAPLRHMSVPSIPILYSPYIVADRQDFTAGAQFLGGPNLQGLDLRGASFRGAAMPAANLTGSAVSGASFAFAVLSNAEMTNINGDFADFSNADLTEATFQKASFSASKFQQANLTQAQFAGASMVESDFSFARINSLVFVTTYAPTANFYFVKGEYLVFDTSMMPGATFVRAQLCRFRFNSAELTETSFAASTLTTGNFLRAQLDDSFFTDSTISNVDFGESSFAGALFLNAKLSNVDFRDAEGLTYEQLQLVESATDVMLPNYLTDAPYASLSVSGDFWSSVERSPECGFVHLGEPKE